MMKTIMLKLLLITSPIILIVVVYFVNDPFKACYHYDSYYKEWDSSVLFPINADMVSTEIFLKDFPKYHYDSYIFGASRASFYFVEDWNKHIVSEHSYHFNSPIESLYGVERKMNFLVNSGAHLRNALIIIDTGLLLRITNEDNVVSRKHPLISGESRFHFQFSFLRSFFDRRFLYAYIDHLITGKIKPYMIRDRLIYRSFIHYQEDCNETKQVAIDDRISRYRDLYYKRRKSLFYPRDPVQRYSEPVIGTPQLDYLNKIKRILDQQHTNYRIVISPLYNQRKISTHDLQILQNTFGTQYVFDFSGINEITNDKYNYYEGSHYRPDVCRKIMDSIYSNTPSQRLPLE